MKRLSLSVRKVDEDLVRNLVQEIGVSEHLARLLVLRGVRSRKEAEVWLSPSISQLVSSELLPDFELARDRIFHAIERQEPVLIWGHDDLDGITATALLYAVLTGLQARAKYHIPVKGKDKHGLDYRFVEKGEMGDIRLIITVDCGITNHQDVATLRERGVDVVVTDHHEVIDPLPEAVAVVDPKRPDANYPEPNLTGVGVALKLALGLVSEKMGFSPKEFFSVFPDALVLAALGTIADRAPLTGENRVLVTLGLRQLDKSNLPAVQAVLRAMGVPPGGFTLAGFLRELLPLFASANGIEGVRHFLDKTPVAAETWVKDLLQRSRAWREEAEKSFVLAGENVRLGDGILFVQHPGLSLRALGSAAGGLREKFGVPAVVMGWRGDAWVGECRSIDSIDLMALLRAMRNYFIDYGGHQKAAGFSIRDEKVTEFIRAAERFAHDNFAPKIVAEPGPIADAFLPLEKFDGQEVIKLAPFGEGNPQPVFLSEPTTFVRRENGLVPQTNSRLLLLPGRCESPIPSGVRYQVLYTVDDLGELTIIDCHSAVESAD